MRPPLGLNDALREDLKVAMLVAGGMMVGAGLMVWIPTVYTWLSLIALSLAATGVNMYVRLRVLREADIECGEGLIKGLVTVYRDGGLGGGAMLVETNEYRGKGRWAPVQDAGPVAVVAAAVAEELRKHALREAQEQQND
jgi:hypothetical protein